MKQALVRAGRVEVAEVPCPPLEKGHVLVAVEHSCISVGTEMSGVRSSAVPLWKRALQNPGKMIWVLNNLRTGGLARTRQMVTDRVSTGRPTGYSAAGRIVGIGEGVEGFALGERVACAGGQCAYHAEIICVPVNLAVPVPENVGSMPASTVALGAIALQGVRRANPTLGETFAVIGLGILGQITVQLLKANGCKVLGLDLEPGRVRLAMQHGLDIGMDPGDDPPLDRVARLTEGTGVDGVIITAATPSNDVLSMAFGLCRKKGRVVLVGDVGLNINRADIYAKELDFFISTSYGPGRYDARFEEEGLDYPISQVRWTETRNMQAYLDLLQTGSVNLDSLLTEVFPIGKVTEAYQALADPSRKVMTALLSYPCQLEHSRQVFLAKPPMPSPGKVRVCLVGAGSFLKGTHLPNLKALSSLYTISAVVSGSGHNAAETARQASASLASTDFSEMTADPAIDAFIITTRHHLHAPQTLAALKAGKHVLCEKPLVLTREELDQITTFFEALPGDQPAPILLTGFNRRFSPYAERIREILKDRTHPMMITYRMCGGHTPPEHWIHGPEGGGRNLAEACHIYDLFGFLTGSRTRSVQVSPLAGASSYYGPRDNFTATISFEDGSVANLSYTTMGSPAHPKEQCEIFCEGKALVLNDYVSLTLAGTKAKGLKTPAQDKGHTRELEAFATAILSGGPWPIPLWQQVQAMEIALEVETRLRESGV